MHTDYYTKVHNLNEHVQMCVCVCRFPFRLLMELLGKGVHMLDWLRACPFIQHSVVYFISIYVTRIAIRFVYISLYFFSGTQPKVSVDKNNHIITGLYKRRLKKACGNWQKDTHSQIR